MLPACPPEELWPEDRWEICVLDADGIAVTRDRCIDRQTALQATIGLNLRGINAIAMAEMRPRRGAADRGITRISGP